MEGSFMDWVFVTVMAILLTVILYEATREPTKIISYDWKCTEYMETKKTCVKYEMVVKK